MSIGPAAAHDRHGDRRNFHIHVDAYDRPSIWLEEEKCWDFEHKVRVRGRDTFPHRQNKVRYPPPIGSSGKVNVSALLRERYIAIANAVVGDRPGVVSFVSGTYAENGIDLTPLDHMGNGAIAAEKRGIATEAGTRNAHRIFADAARACERRAETAQRELTGEKELMRGALNGQSVGSELLEAWAALEKQIIRRQLQADIANLVVDMSRSRADAVIRAAAEQGPAKKAEAALIASAEEHLAWVTRHTPAAGNRDRERKALTKLKAKAEALRVALLNEVVRDERPARPSYTYSPRQHRTVPLSVPHPDHAEAMRTRLCTWLERHLTDRDHLFIQRGVFRLGPAAPKALDLLMQRFAAHPKVQHLIWLASQRRGMLPDPTTRTSSLTPAEIIAARAGMHAIAAELYGSSVKECRAPATTGTAVEARRPDPTSLPTRGAREGSLRDMAEGLAQNSSRETRPRGRDLSLGPSPLTSEQPNGPTPSAPVKSKEIKRDRRQRDLDRLVLASEVAADLCQPDIPLHSKSRSPSSSSGLRVLPRLNVVHPGREADGLLQDHAHGHVYVEGDYGEVVRRPDHSGRGMAQKGGEGWDLGKVKPDPSDAALDTIVLQQMLHRQVKPSGR